MENSSDEEPPGSKKILPRGKKAMLPHGGLPEVVSPYLIKLIGKTGGAKGPIGRQFIAQPRKERTHFSGGASDPLAEKEHEVAPGLIYKYKGKISKNGQVLYHGRVLWMITRFCGSYCRFCTRGREVGIQQPLLTDKEILQVFDYLKRRKEINEVILSGGDPLATPRAYLTKIIAGLVNLQQEGAVRIVRLGTRLPIHNPSLVQNWHYRLLARLKNPYLMVHINHPAEMSPKTLEVLGKFRKISGATVLSQTVFLKGVNDSVQTLSDLFNKMVCEGIRPYYVYQNDPVYWAIHFTVPIKKAIQIWEKVRPRLSGLAATARFVIDAPFGFGKIPIPEGGAWSVDYSRFFDFKKKPHNLK